ncbi:hypothetical protein [Tatumella sp. JGM118]|uniref:hypothetical protein n=1 Tax=Tatumella TaxID=82986 RepID=UPI001BAFD876|nr:hypothetical protein [Tatumella sp. JGM118]MBS0909708.1 hypothetical protein [Tatumella sp. JGM118]
MPAATMAGIAWWNLLQARQLKHPCMTCTLDRSLTCGAGAANLYSLVDYSLKAKKPVTIRHWLSH